MGGALIVAIIFQSLHHLVSVFAAPCRTPTRARALLACAVVIVSVACVPLTVAARRKLQLRQRPVATSCLPQHAASQAYEALARRVARTLTMPMARRGLAFAGAGSIPAGGASQAAVVVGAVVFMRPEGRLRAIFQLQGSFSRNWILSSSAVARPRTLGSWTPRIVTARRNITETGATKGHVP